jgi:alpha-1,2-mannosyltransferase
LRTASLSKVGWCSWLPSRLAVGEFTLAVGGLILGVWGSLWLGPLYVEAMRPAAGRLNDFFQDWGSARNYLTGLPVYSPHTMSVPRHLGIPFDPGTGIYYNAHPPTSVLLALPLAYLNFPDAVLVWNTISLVAFLLSLGIVAKSLQIPKSLFLPILALLIFCQPLFGTLYQGQLTLLLVLLVTTVWMLERSGRSYAAGVLIGVAAAIKLFPAYLALYFVARGRWRPLLAATVSLVVLTIVTTAILGLETDRDYVQVVLPTQTRFRGLAYNCAISGFWYKLFDPVGERGRITPLWSCPALAQIGTLFSDLAITLVVGAHARWARTRSQQDLAFGAVVTAMLLVSPVSWDVSLPLLLVPIAVVGSTARRPYWISVAFLLALGLIWMPQLLPTKVALSAQPARGVSWAFVLGPPSLKSYALLGLLVLPLAALRTARDASQHGSGNSYEQSAGCN